MLCSGRFGRVRWIVPSLLLLGLAVAGCGSSSKGGGGGASAPAGSATVSTMTVIGYGKALATSGHPLYLLSSDPPGGSRCTGRCTSTWPPVTAKGAPTAGPGVNSSLLSTFKRPDGGTQVLYDRHALYTHRGRGLVSGAGVRSEGGTWYLVAPSGKPIKATKRGDY
jgi:predicted lipoprotein with Yx(FWY)xxD motif